MFQVSRALQRRYTHHLVTVSQASRYTGQGCPCSHRQHDSSGLRRYLFDQLSDRHCAFGTGQIGAALGNHEAGSELLFDLLQVINVIASTIFSARDINKLHAPGPRIR